MEHITHHDLLILGAGAAGLRAAISATELNPKINIAVISKVYPVRSHTIAAEGGIAAPIGEDDSPLIHAEDTVHGGDFLSDQDTVEFFTERCAKEVELLDSWGCPWDRHWDGSIAIRKFGGMTTPRTVYAEDKTGFFIMHNLFERSLKYENIHRYDEWFVTKIITEDNKIKGVTALNLNTGKLAGFSAKAVIVATGGAGQVYKTTTNAEIKTGDGIALAFKAGAALKDMEFIQFHPTTLPQSGILISEAARGEGGYLINRNNKRFLKDYTPGKMELGPRDLLCKAILEEIHAGRGITDEFTKEQYVHLDLRHLGAKMINQKLARVKVLTEKYINRNPIKDLIPVKPAQHYTIGGIYTNKHGFTSVNGLFSAGESACTGLHGTNRLGSNSLAECLIFGAEAGKSAIHHIEDKAKTVKLSEKEIMTDENQINDIINSKGKENPHEILKSMKEVMEERVGLVRNETDLKKAEKQINSLKSRAKNISINDKSKVHNMELIKTLELKNMLTVADIIIKSAIERKESRGCHHRKDFPHKNDAKYLHHNLFSITPSGTSKSETNTQKKSKSHNNPPLTITKQPVTITKWQPNERKV